MRKLVTTATIIVTAAAVAAVPALAATRTVKATEKNRWSPSGLTVKKGDTVRFTWNTKAPHNIRKTSGRGRLVGGSKISKRGSGSFKVPARGTYRFICDVHPGTMKFTLRATS